MRLSILLLFVSISFCGCFTRWVMTEKELKHYYADKPGKPIFFTIQNDSIQLFCATSGADTLPPLLLIHGAPGAWYGSRNMLADTLLQKHFHIIAMDRPGYNKSRFKNKNKAVTSLEIQAAAILEALRLNRSREKAIILGSSYGAPIAAKAVLMQPEKFNHLVMLAAAIDPDKEKFWWFHKYIHRGPIHWFLPRFLRNATDEKFAHIKELRKLSTEWSSLNVPVTVMQGGADDIIDPLNIEFAKKQLEGKHAEFIYLPDAGHMLRFRQAGLVREVLLHILEKSHSKPSAELNQ